MTGNGTEVTANSAVQRVYSEDKKIYLGITVKDAAKDTETMKIFNFADINKNGVIDQSEIDRYNGPIIVENVETREGRILGNYAGRYAFGSFDGELIKDNEIAYYPGLEIENVDEKGRITFTQIDLNHDGKISKKEIEKVKEESEKIAKTREKYQQLIIKNAKRQKFATISTVAVGLLSIIAAGISSSPLLLPVGFSLSLLGPLVAQSYYEGKNKEQKKELKNQCIQEINNPYVKEQAMKNL